jgi:hypothetical protein
MTAAVHFDPDFPHGTVEGYDRGCRGNICPAKEQYGWTCARARERFNGDHQWRSWVLAGLTLEQIAVADREASATEKERAKVAAAAERAQAKADAAAAKHRKAALAKAAAERRPIGKTNNPLGRPPLPAEHGTPRKWKQGCKIDADCPATPTCRQAKNAHHTQLRLKAKEDKS